uniref:putative group II intron reverse transcriptase/maturase mat7 n=1 Tax=Strombomonas costata TaxID=161230 RepID=UPI0023AB2E59|nr:putative group II intron reverse transcriptase/maturase mat7 [Strombomonas costata]WCH63646.1 putative group II intron reverse transcriptase/maturase mat7 [Strombomonas costata]
MKAKTIYNKKIADKFHDSRYYESNEQNIKDYEFIENERKRTKTSKKKEVSDIIRQKVKGITVDEKEENIFIILKNIYEKNKKFAFKLDNNTKEPINSDLINLVSDVSLLMVSYAKVRKNPGATTLAHQKSKAEYNKLNSEQKDLINRTDEGVDGIDMDLIKETSRLLRKGEYPWGTSRRIYIDKPGKPDAKRPITIPPFMDRVVQEAIKQVLVAIFEPYFDASHCSVGFRPNRSVHDAINILTNPYTSQGLTMALEGDIKAAYDKVNRKKLIEILGKKIKDRKFLELIKKRLDYEYYDTKDKKFCKENEGLPQGGTDSPYLWNIYMLEFDNFILNHIKDYIETINTKNRKSKTKDDKILHKERQNRVNHKLTVNKILEFIRSKNCKNFKDDLIKLSNTNIKDWKKTDPIFTGGLKKAKETLLNCDLTNQDEGQIIKSLQKIQRSLRHQMNNLPFLDLNHLRIRIVYVRYADDWIILTNMKEDILRNIKEKISNFLSQELYATLSNEKTLITDIREAPAHFLGFEIRTYRGRKIGKYTTQIRGKEKIVTAKVAGNRVFASVDKQRLIDRLHMKGYCDIKGFPREITKLNNLEAFTIIDKTNSVLVGLYQYYYRFIRRPNTQLSRWVYIIRYSCMKTIALKHKLTLRKVFKKFKPNNIKYEEQRTIEDTIEMNFEGITYNKTWKLHTPQSLQKFCSTKKAFKYRKIIENRFWSLYKGKPVEEDILDKEDNKKVKTNITRDDFLERTNWVNIRTRSSFDLPCSLCGSTENIEMHHENHVRKTSYKNIKQTKTWQQVMGLRNRRQIPVCRNCHRNIIHKGKYQGEPLKSKAIEMYDNRIVNIESYIHPGDPEKNYKKTLQQKGWKVVSKGKEKDKPSI